MLVVHKYGGTSVGTIDNIKEIARHLVDLSNQGFKIVCVASAMGKTTDYLMDMAYSISDNPSAREIDSLLSTGEQQTITLLSMAIQSLGHKATSLTGMQLNIKTTDRHLKGKIIDINTDLIKTKIDEGNIVIVAGFQGVNEIGDIVTLGRGGSDTTAVAISAKLNCICKIFTDVDGVYRVDPRIYLKAKKLDYISYEQMMEMANLGASVLEPRSVEIAMKYDIPLYIGRSLSLDGGTYIMNSKVVIEDKVISGVSVNDDITVISFKGIKNEVGAITNIFTSLEEYDINVDMITKNRDEYDNLLLSLSIDSIDLPLVEEMIVKNPNIFSHLTFTKRDNLSKLSVVGVGMSSHSGVAGSVFRTLFENGIEYYHVSTSQISISVTIDNKNKDKAVNLLALKFELWK